MLSRILNYLGILMMLSATFYIPPMIVALIYAESLTPFLVPLIASLMVGFILKVIAGIEKIVSEQADLSLSFTESLILSASALLSLSAVSSFAYILVIREPIIQKAIDALFESVSGFTTTGLTILTNIEAVPRSLLFWRAETQWIGGIGIVIMFVFLVTKYKTAKDRPGESNKLISSYIRLYLSQGFSEKIEPSLKRSAKEILRIYAIYTLVGISLLFLSGLPIFEAITICFTAIATGGFIVTEAFYSNILQLGIIIVLMILGASSFVIHGKLFKGKLKDFFFDYRFIVLMTTIVIGILVVTVSGGNLGTAIFQLTSAITGTGFSIVDNNTLSPIFTLLVVIFMVIGGMLGSTCGGIKISRFYMVLKSVPWIMRKLTNPSTAVVPFKLKKDMPIEEEQMMMTYVFITTYVLLIVVATIAFLLMGYGFLDSSFQVTSALGTVGLSTMSLTTVPLFGKLILILLMLFGRLEIFPLLIIIKNVFSRR
ncbi:hypothetical protein COV93_04820 [Candidatus Woesearchaeota archaeon CG11_big_fil_rev_8_21_14_0_20_43_8]|nr:MAG: hypothetical protein COV93_04820 [Candidatus Woesearchaeota archaeon CG11_big_fil_rev_8_21_14_0_20_43_8]